MSLLTFAPTVDGDVVPRMPLEAFADGQSGDVPVLIGSTRDEARLFLVAAQSIDLIDDATLVAAAGAYGLGPDGVDVYRTNRPAASPGDLLAAVITDWFFRVPGVRVAEARTGTTWVYRFDHPDPAVNDGLRACHGAEIPFVTDGAPGWASYTPESRTTALLADKVSEVDDPAGDERVLWEGIR